MLTLQAIRAAANGNESGKATAEGATGTSGASAEGAQTKMEEEEEEEEDEEDPAEAETLMPIRGPLPPQEGTWASCVRLLDPVEGKTVECLELGE